MPATKKSVKSVRSVKKVIVKQDACPCGCGCGADCPCSRGGECACGCGCGNSVKYTSINAAWRAFWRRGYCEWAGTSSRSEYWLAWVGNMLAILLFCALGVIAYGIDTVIWNNVGVLSGFVGFVCAIYLIASIIPAISMMTRRMHDAGLSAWLWLVYIPSVAAYCPVGLIVSLLPTVVVGNKFHKNNK